MQALTSDFLVTTACERVAGMTRLWCSPRPGGTCLRGGNGRALGREAFESGLQFLGDAHCGHLTASGLELAPRCRKGR